MKHDLEIAQEELTEKSSKCKEAIQKYSEILDENAVLRKKNKGNLLYTHSIIPGGKEKQKCAYNSSRSDGKFRMMVLRCDVRDGGKYPETGKKARGSHEQACHNPFSKSNKPGG